MKTKLLLSAIAALLLSATGHATQFYIDFANGSDLNAGTTPITPFKHAPDDVAATGNAAAVILAPSDAILFKGGVAYVGSLSCPCNAVTYDGGSFGPGRAILSGQNSTVATIGLSAKGKSGLVIENLELSLYGGRSAPWAPGDTKTYRGFGIKLDDCTNAVIRNCYAHDLGDWQNQPNASQAYMEGVGIQVVNGGTGISITGCEFTKIGRAAIQIQPQLGSRTCTAITIAQNDFHDFVRWGVDLGVSGPNCTLNGVTIEANRFHDTYQYSLSTWLGLAGANPHVDNIIMYVGNNPAYPGQTLGTAASPIIVRGNRFWNNAPTTLEGGTASIFLTVWGGRVLIYNNTFVNVLNHGEGAVYAQDGAGAGNPSPDYWIFNNTFYDNVYAVVLRTITAPLTTYALNLGTTRVKNNIFYKANADSAISVVSGLDAFSNPTELDYNLYRTGRTDGVIAHTYANGAAGYRTLAALRAEGFETHGAVGDPLFSNISFGLGLNSGSNDVSLKPGSAAIGSGADLSPLFSPAWNKGTYAP